ncbi:MAG: protein kinase [Gemmatimonadales bacterium]|nr:protein kinase [Gemmatimonadales bacterium]NIN11893.1 protein kinase [Gemmatimonadales bacterium]NIN50443.1 protein kinase [Gemmatimonadales bacterium]NIP07907.1 protein kinase [Gemmatimonadales bacterium]NIR01931.1 protein kinase [Gemmatimonadales bacterium]
MTDPDLVRRRDTAPSGIVAARLSAGLPQDLVDKAGQRLGLAALVYAAAYFLAYGTGRLTQDFAEHWGAESVLYPSDFTAAGFIALSLGMFLVARSGRIVGARLLDLGLIYEVVAAAGIDVGLAWGHWPQGLPFHGLSWVCVWIVFFPLIVPSTAGKTFLAALAAASTTPLMYLIGVAGGAEAMATPVALQFMIPNYICAGIAVVGSRVVYRLGSDISKARRMGSYQLVERLGVGGMGEVWKAEHRMLARPAAIKLIVGESLGTEPGRTPGSYLHRFEREVQATAQLRSPHTVEVYDYGMTEDRRFYYVMELLDGLNLEHLVAKYGPLPADRAVHILEQVCHSLSEAHAKGLVHRDVKPANIFICRYGRDVDFVKVLDFGLVKQAPGTSKQEVKLTEVGSFAGTPAYGSPEGALGEGDDVDARSDVYSLGCVAFWLLTGRTVFRAATSMQMLVQHINTEPDPPSRHTELEVPPALDRLILQCLRKDKAERPQSADALAAGLAAIALSRPWTQDRARQWWEHHRPRAVEEPVGAAVSGETSAEVSAISVVKV